MDNKTFDEEITTLEDSYESLLDRDKELTSKIENAENEQDDVENSMDNIEKEIDKIKSKMSVNKIKELNAKVDDQFTSDFIKASYFTATVYHKRPMLCLVNVSNNELQATDGYKAIIIKNNKIPEKLRNHMFKWNVRSNYENNIDYSEKQFINLQEIMSLKENIKYKISEVNTNNFYKTFKPEICSKDGKKVVILEYKNFKIAFNKEFIDDALMILREEVFTIYLFSDKQPMIIRSKRMQILLLPMSL